MTGDVRIIGTAHVSQKSIDEVREAIEDYQPDVVAVELDSARYASIKQQNQESPDVDDILKGGNFSQLIVQWILAYLQRRIGMDVGIQPGAEMISAIYDAEQKNIPVALIDRDIRITLNRFWKSMGIWEKLKMIYALIVSVTGVEEEEINIDDLTKTDVVSLALEEFRKFSPNAAKALIDERDAYLANNILKLREIHSRVLVVVGAGHVAGINDYLSNPQALPEMNTLVSKPKTKPWGLIIGSIVIALFVILFTLIILSGIGLDVLLTALLYWILINGILAAGFTLAAGGHPFSALTAFGISWMTSLNPLLAAGWFAALTEAKIRKPGSDDFKKIFNADSFGELRQIPLFRVVLVAALANIGSMIGTFAYFIFIFPILGIDPAQLINAGFENLITSLHL